MKLADFEETDLCDICGTGQSKRIVDGLFVCGACYRTKKTNFDRPILDPEDDLPIKRSKHVRSKTRG